MMYEEFIKRLPEDVKRPTYAEYTDFIEPVYMWHPALDGNFAKDKTAKLYCVGGLGIFATMRDAADYAKDADERISGMRHKSMEAMKARDAAKRALEEAQAAFDSAMEELKSAMAELREFRAAVRKDWEV